MCNISIIADKRGSRGGGERVRSFSMISWVIVVKLKRNYWVVPDSKHGVRLPFLWVMKREPKKSQKIHQEKFIRACHILHSEWSECYGRGPYKFSASILEEICIKIIMEGKTEKLWQQPQMRVSIVVPAHGRFYSWMVWPTTCRGRGQSDW